MCGILGILSKNQIDQSQFNESLHLLQHRGPEGEHTEHFDMENYHVALGHCRLSIVDLSNNGFQPFSSNDNNIIAVTNGEFYGYEDIRSDLIAEGYQFKSECDSEVLVHLYHKYGIQAVKFLHGEWAFILFDKTKNLIYAARDHLGIKPLYYYKDNEQIIFSSEIKGFKNLTRLQMAKYTDLSSFISADVFGQSNETSFDNVYHVYPGSVLIVDPLIDIKTYQYKVLNFAKQKLIKSSQVTEREYINLFKSKLDNAVKKRLKADVPVALYLSGGIDSTSILAMACKYQKRIDTFSIVFPNESDSDESYYINKVVEFYNRKGNQIVHHTVDFIKPDENLLKKGVWHTESCMSDEVAVSLMKLSALVQECGYKVVLTGQGGDEILGGYPWTVIDNLIENMTFWDFLSLKLDARDFIQDN